MLLPGDSYLYTMKHFLSISWLVLILFSCQPKQSETKAAAAATPPADSTVPSFFPVTAFIKGQLFEIKQSGINPIRYTQLENGKTDSSWIKVEALETELNECLHPVIDSTNMVPYFTEKAFMDETLGLFTMTYDRKPASIPDSINWRTWNVYIDPETNEVVKIFLVKALPKSLLQITWKANQECMLKEIDRNEKATKPLLKDITYRWKY